MFNFLLKIINGLPGSSRNRLKRRQENRKKMIIIFSIIIFFGILVFTIFNFNKKTTSPEIFIRDNKKDCLKLENMDWCESSKQCFKTGSYFCPDGLSVLIKGLEGSSEAKLNNVGTSSFPWISNTEEKKVIESLINGYQYQGEMSLAQVKKMENFLETEAVLDIFNMANGVAGGLRGYYYQDFACVLDYRYKEMQEEKEGRGMMMPVSDLLVVKFKCGPLNK